jgi:tight adherence protein C
MADPVAVDAAALLPALFAALGGAALTAVAMRPPARLGPRVRPYNSANRVRLGRPADVQPSAGAAVLSGGALVALLAPILASTARQLSRLVDREGDDALLLRLRRAGAYGELPLEQRLQAYRQRRLLSVAASIAGFCAPALATGNARLLVIAAPLAVVFGSALPRARLDRAIDARRERMRIDLYTVNQQLAMYQHSAGGVDEALQRLVRRGRGEVVAELAEALRWRRAGLPLHVALLHLAELTPEAHAARSYKALAKAAETGAPIADALLHLSEDVRASRRDALARLATQRRAAMLLPLIVLLVPPLLLLVGAPIPSQLFGSMP